MPKGTQAYDFDSDRPEVILANAQARAAILEARAKLHPLSQFTLSFFEGLKDVIAKIGCISVILVIALGVVLIFAGPALNALMCR
jgi:hypothetical protein